MRGTRLAAAAGAVFVLASMGITLANTTGGELGDDNLVSCQSVSDSGQPQITFRSDRWIRIKAPKFDTGEGPSQITSFAALPYGPDGLFVTNGHVLKLSANGGCTWKTVFTPPHVDQQVPGYTPDVVTQVVAASDTVPWVTTYDDIGGVPHPHVYRISGTDTASPASTQIDVGLPEYGKPVSLVVSPNAISAEAYLLADQLPDPSTGSVSASRHLYGTYVPTDAATAAAQINYAWREITPPAGFGHIDGLSYEAGQRIWIWSGRKYAWTHNAGAVSSNGTSTATWQTGTAANPIVTVDVNFEGQVSVIESTGSAGTINVFDQRGRLVVERVIPIAPASFAHGSGSNVYAVSGPDGTRGFDHRLQKWVDITPRNGPAFPALTMAHGKTDEVVIGQTSSALWRWDTYYDETFIKPPPPPVGSGQTVLPTSTVDIPTLCVSQSCTTPASRSVRQVVTVTPGKISRVPVAFLDPPEATPLDVYYLVDTTESMSPAIEGLKRAVVSISRKLRSMLGTSICFGVGDVKDWDPESTTFRSPYVFKTLLPVSPCDNSSDLKHVVAATKQLVERGGYDIPEAQTVGLTQAVTGHGSTYPPEAAGQQAGFRAGAFKVIVLITDSNSHEGGGYPTVDETVRTLNSQDVKVVSIAVDSHSPNANVHAAQEMMNRIAIGTRSLTPASGVDCNGDGGGHDGDLGPGMPLVCTETPTNSAAGGPIVNLAPAVIGLLLGVTDPGLLEARIADPDGALKAPIIGRTSDVRNMKYQTGLGFTLPVGCSADQVGKNLPVTVTPYVRSVSTGLRGQVVVQCRALPHKLSIPPPAAELFVVPHVIRPPVAVPAPPPPPGQPVTNLNMNTGMAREEQQQPQLAMAAQDDALTTEEQPDEALAMSALRQPRPSHEVEFVLAAAAMFAAAAGCQMHLRRRSAAATQQAR